ncbi:hypothetical protein [Nocardia transvalensis]|uniref:hypothetical protein n=1 Tax=Nocardia transvalensis TaxID=37333 RepID=UPI00189485A9|nr:hypothetical protein [Nocardia transvalensis]MBF6332638.1 hypothetical protein [Nocardia transvalensis]
MTTRYISWVTLALMTTSSVASLRAAPMDGAHLLSAWTGVASLVLIVNNFLSYSGPGSRPVIADSDVIMGTEPAIETYCPDNLSAYLRQVDKLKLGETTK